MIYYFLLSTIGLACVVFGFSVYLPATNYVTNPSKSLIVISLLYAMACFFLTNALMSKKKTIKYKNQSITLTYEDKMFIDLIRKNNYQIDPRDKKMFENKGKFLAGLTSFCLTLITFIRLIYFLNIKIDFSSINEDLVFFFIMGFIFFVSIGNLLSIKSRKYNILPYYVEYMKLDTIYEYSRKFTDDEMTKDQYDEYKNTITEELGAKIKTLIEIDKNTDYLKKNWLFS